jgi:hypothetical protein
MKPVALICAAAVVGIAHSARVSPNVYEAVVEVAEEEREASHAKQMAAEHDLDQVLAVDKIGSKVVSEISKSVKPFRPSKPLKDEPMTSAWQKMSSLVSDMKSDAERGRMDPSVQAALASEKEKVTKTEDTGMEYKVFEAETTLGEAEQKRRKADIERLSPLAAGQSWGSISAAEEKSAKTIIAPDVRAQNWQSAETKELTDGADALKKGPALLENMPKKKKLGAVHKDAHVNNGAKTAHDGNKVWPNVMPSMQVAGDEEQLRPKAVPVKQEPKKVAPVTATYTDGSKKAATPQNKAIQEEAMRDLNMFHSDPMYQHLLGPSEDPELSAQTQQDLKLLHRALGKNWVPPASENAPVKPAASKPAVKNVVSKPAPPHPVARQPVPPPPKPVAHKPVAANPVHKPAAPEPVMAKHAVPQAVAAPPHAQTPRKPAVPQHMQSAPVHVAPKASPKHAVPKPQVSVHPPAQVHQQQPAARTQPAAAAAAAVPKVALRPPAAKKMGHPKPRGAKLWSPEMDSDHPKKLSREDSLEARVAEEASETRKEMEQELSAPDEEFPIQHGPTKTQPTHHSFSHASTRHKGRIPSPMPAPAPAPAAAPGGRLSEGYGTKTVPFEGNPSQGLDGQWVNHEDGKSMTKDWGTEYGEHHAAPAHKESPAPVKGAAAAWTVSCLAAVLLVLN